MRRKDHGPIVGDFVELVDEHRPLGRERVDHIAVVDDLVAHIDRGAEALERELDDLDGTVDPGAESARGRDEDMEGWLVHAAGRRCKASLAGFKAPSYEDAPPHPRAGQPKDDVQVKLRILALLSLTLIAGCRNRGDIVDTKYGVYAVRSACPVAGIPAGTGDITLFDPPGSTDSRAIDVT